ncbi:hypothetical protein [Paenibacillus glycanilyticus]|uniref:hypothetical protein n=1 Tax=Paenibacillus glycanilyticus TaxID=126569 RepID=UPI0019101EE7|nr:hypothetical protein [Paenibacillus glycanilyticus]
MVILSYITKEELIEEIVSLRNFILINDKYRSKHLRKCKKIEMELSQKEYNLDGLIKIKYQIISLKIKTDTSETKKKTAFFRTAVATIILYGIATIIYKNLLKLNLDFILEDFVIYIRLILVGVLGSLAYQFSRVVGSEDDTTIRFTMSIILPTVFISLFLYNEDKILGISPLSLCIFAGGYCTELILGFFNNIVDHAKKLLNVENNIKINTASNNNSSSDKEMTL